MTTMATMATMARKQSVAWVLGSSSLAGWLVGWLAGSLMRNEESHIKIYAPLTRLYRCCGIYVF